MRVVVVDDHPVFRKGLVALLSADGIEVVGEAENGLEAIAVVAETSPDVVLMDLGMPELGGIEATEHIVATEAPTIAPPQRQSCGIGGCSCSTCAVRALWAPAAPERR
jgi:DNA-binding NarL/FixJ family response regulator